MAENPSITNPSALPLALKIEDFFAEAQDAVEHIQGALRHRQQPQDVTFHRALKALRDGRDATREIARMQRRIDELENYINGVRINCAAILNTGVAR
jgi:hypothetical protein